MAAKRPMVSRSKKNLKSKSGPTPSARAKSHADKADESASPQDFPIVGIGASAGGLEAYTELFRLLPPDTGMAFVLVQHLSPQHVSMLSLIIQKTTKMDVQEVVEGMRIAPNNVYVIPPNYILEIFHGVLHLRLMEKPHATNRLVDTFFRSLAHDHSNLAVGIVLSGTGSDGSQGLRDIKAEGGLSFVQDPETAKFDGMPTMAIAVDHPDCILPIKGLVRELIKVAAHPQIMRALPVESKHLTSADELDLKHIFLLIRSALGTDFSVYKTPTILRRIRRRMVLHRIDNLRHYRALLESSKSETKSLFTDLLINVTEFFRDAKVFDALKAEIFPKILNRRAAGDAIRIWVPGCSTGEEVYSIAISLVEYLGDEVSKYPIQFYGTDVGEASITKARAGLFNDSIAKQVSELRLDRFFIKDGENYKISPRIRECCIFSVQDVTSDPPIHRLDLLSCRNLMIYLGASVQKQLMESFFYAIKSEGFLLLGSSESVGTAASLFAIVDEKHKIYAKRETASSPRRSAVNLKERDLDGNMLPGAIKREKSLNAERSDPIAIAERLVAEKFAPPWILVNHAMDIVQFKGSTENFISHRSGQPSWNLFKMLREELVAEVRILLHSVDKGEVVARKSGLSFRSDGMNKALDIETHPIVPEGIDPHYLVLFFERTPETLPKRNVTLAEQSQVVKLSEELAASQKSLRSFMEDQNSTNEELHSANEEILSANEELQSTNEELETAKEELQSTNEELTTLNEELSNRNAELSESNNDLSNVLSNSQGSIVIVNASLKIRRLTSAASKLLNIALTDIGRKLIDFNLGFPMDILENKLTEVIRNVSTVEFEARNHAGNYFSVRLRPYVTADNRIEGAVVSFIDIDEIKDRERGIEATQRYSNAIIQTMHEPLVVLNGDLRVQRVNRAFYGVFEVDEQATIGRHFYDLGNLQWDVPELRKLLEEILPNKSEVEGFKVIHEFEKIGKKTMLINARRLEWEQQKELLILLAIQELRADVSPGKE